MLWMAVMKRKKMKRKKRKRKKRNLTMGKLPMSAVVNCVCYVGLWKALYVGSLLIVIHGVVDEVAVEDVVVKKMKKRESLEGKCWSLMVMKKLAVKRRHGGFEALERQWPSESSSGVST